MHSSTSATLVAKAQRDQRHRRRSKIRRASAAARSVERPSKPRARARAAPTRRRVSIELAVGDRALQPVEDRATSFGEAGPGSRSAPAKAVTRAPRRRAASLATPFMVSRRRRTTPSKPSSRRSTPSISAGDSAGCCVDRIDEGGATMIGTHIAVRDQRAKRLPVERPEPRVVRGDDVWISTRWILADAPSPGKCLSALR